MLVRGAKNTQLAARCQMYRKISSKISRQSVQINIKIAKHEHCCLHLFMIVYVAKSFRMNF